MSGKPVPKVVVIGGGFAGLSATQALRKSKVDVTLVDRRNFHLFQPLLYQVATGELSPSNIASPLRSILRKQKNATVLLGEVNGVDLDKKLVTLSDDELSYDYLIVAAGSTHHYFGNDQWAKLAPGLKTIENATEIRRLILRAFEAAERCEESQERQDLLTFIIVGAGPTGCELAGALAEVAFHTMKGDFRRIDPCSARIILVEPTANPLTVYPSPLPERAAADLRHLGVEIKRGFHVSGIEPECVKITSKEEGTQEIRTRNVIWAAGVKGVAMGEQICKQTTATCKKSGRVPVSSDTSVIGHANVFICGDLASFEDPKKGELPCLAPVATQMGRHAARCISNDLRGRPRKPFQYFDKGSLAVIGRYRAVGTIGNLRLKGFIAWFLWLFIHLMYITRFRNRILVLIQWGWTFITRDRSSRLITGSPQPLPPEADELMVR